jgi:tetratricopeptide (TPR) repeat protein
MTMLPADTVTGRHRLSVFWPLLVEKIPLLLLAVGFCVVTPLAEGKAVTPLDVVPISWRMANVPLCYVAYLVEFFYPVGLAAPYPYLASNLAAGKVAGAALLLIGISAVAAAWRRRFPHLFVGWFWYVGMLVPMIGIVQVGEYAMADRFTYLPQIGLGMALVWLSADICRTWPSRRWVCGGTTALVLAVFMACTWRQTCFWRDSEIFWAHTLACTSQNREAHYNLGCYLLTRNRFDEAIRQFRQVLEIDPRSYEAYNNLGGALTRVGRVDEAVAFYEKSLAIRPQHTKALSSLGNILLSRGRIDEAIGQFRKAVEVEPGNPVAHVRLGNALICRGQLAEAAAHYRAALRLDPENADADRALSDVLARQGRLDEAISHYQAVLDTQPTNAEAHCQLGMALLCEGRFDEGTGHLQRALEIQPDHTAAHHSLALALAGKGRYDQAVIHFRKAIAAEPHNAEVQKNLAWLRATCPERSLRNGPEAIELAEKANRSAGGKRADVLDALAAAYAETGWFPEAVAAEGKALELAGQRNDPTSLPPMRARLALYKAARPYRETPAASVPTPARP